MVVSIDKVRRSGIDAELVIDGGVSEVVKQLGKLGTCAREEKTNIAAAMRIRALTFYGL